MRDTNSALVRLTARSHDAGDIWVDVATAYTDGAELVASGSTSLGTLAEMQQASADAQQRPRTLAPTTSSAQGGIGPLHARLVREDQAPLPLEQAFLRAPRAGQAAQADGPGCAPPWRAWRTSHTSSDRVELVRFVLTNDLAPGAGDSNPGESGT